MERVWSDLSPMQGAAMATFIARVIMTASLLFIFHRRFKLDLNGLKKNLSDKKFYSSFFGLAFPSTLIALITPALVTLITSTIAKEGSN